MNVPRLALVLSMPWTFASPVLAQSPFRFDPVADVTLRSDQPTTNAGSALELGLAKDKSASGATYFMRTLFRFDLSTLAGQPIRKATLRFYQQRSSGAGSLPVDLFRLTQPFQESTVTWATAPTDDGNSAASVPVGDNFNAGWKDFDATAMVRAWVGGATNHGCVIRLARESTAGARRPAWGPSREAATNKPYLEVDTSPAGNFGKGCGPVATWPRIALTSGTPRINTPITVTGSLLAPSRTAITAIGLSDTSWNGIPLPYLLDGTVFPTCQLLVAGHVLVFSQTDAQGQLTISAGIPNDPALRGLRVFMQMASTGSPTHLTDGLDLTIY